MDLLAELGRTLGFSFAAGINLYATVALAGAGVPVRLGRAARAVSGVRHTWVIYTALVLYAIEFLADKIPWVDSRLGCRSTRSSGPSAVPPIAVIALGPASPDDDRGVGA